jgi:hypothetical protein
MDGDDRCHPRRLGLQVQRLERERSLGILGTAVRLWRGASLRRRAAETGHEALRAQLAFENGIAHPSVMLRRSALGPLRYREGWTAAEDYDLWTRAALRTRLGNLPQALLDYRLHPQQSGAAKAAEQYQATTRLRLRYLKDLGFRLSAAQAQAHALLCPPFGRREAGALPAVAQWLRSLLEQPESLGLEPGPWRREARRRFAAYALAAGPRGLTGYALHGAGLRSAALLSPAALRSGAKALLKP